MPVQLHEQQDKLLQSLLAVALVLVLIITVQQVLLLKNVCDEFDVLRAAAQGLHQTVQIARVAAVRQAYELCAQWRR